MKVQFEKKELIKAVTKAGKIAFSYKTNELYNNLKITYSDTENEYTLKVKSKLEYGLNIEIELNKDVLKLSLWRSRPSR